MPEGELVEQSEAHVVIFLGLRLGFLGSGSSSRGSLTSGSSSSGSGGGSSGGDGAKLLCALLDQLGDILAGQLGHNLVHLLVIGVDTNGAKENISDYSPAQDIKLGGNKPEDFLDVVSGDLLSSLGGEQSSSDVTHF